MRTVLVVYDRSYVLNILRYHLGCEGYIVLTAASGSQALDLIRDNTVDALIIGDLVRLEPNGCEVIQQVRRDPAHQGMKIIALTKRAHGRAAAIEAGADEADEMPLKPPMLAEQLKMLLNGAHVASR